MQVSNTVLQVCFLLFIVLAQRGARVIINGGSRALLGAYLMELHPLDCSSVVGHYKPHVLPVPLMSVV